MTPNYAPAKYAHTKHRQRGVVLFVALVMLVAMSMAGIALMRSVSGGVMLAGNLSMKTVTTRASEFAIEEAAEWLDDDENDDLLDADTDAYVEGYSTVMNGPATPAYAKDSQGLFDPINQPAAFWGDDGPARTLTGDDVPADLEGFTARYVIHRMCETPGDASSDCVKFSIPDDGCSPDVDPKLCDLGSGRVLYRVTVYITGPKNTDSFVQVMMY
jgi:type IV pilus assembly protein PilX